jgi:hypothetical protein
MRAVAAPGRWVWGGIGLATAAVLAVPGTRLITSPGHPWHGQPPQDIATRTVTVPQAVSSLTVQSYGAPVGVTAGTAGRVQVIEKIWYDKQAGPPAVTASVSAGHLTLAAPACGGSDCSVGFSVTVPPKVTVAMDTGGGPATVSGTAGTDVSSEGGAVRATNVDGPLTVTSSGGPVLVDGLAGPLRVSSDGGAVIARGVDAATATVTTGGGPASIAFPAAPDAVKLSTDGGSAILAMPGGPYALSASTDGGTELLGIATDPFARRSITVTTGGGPLVLRPFGEASSAGGAGSSSAPPG